MNQYLLFGLLLSILIIGTLQQTATPNPTPTPTPTPTPAHTPTPTPNPNPNPNSIPQARVDQFNNALKRSLQEQQGEIEKEMSKKLRNQIVIWTSIALSFVLYFSVMCIIEMPNPKSSILYAKYDTTRGGNEF